MGFPPDFTHPWDSFLGKLALPPSQPKPVATQTHTSSQAGTQGFIHQGSTSAVGFAKSSPEANTTALSPVQAGSIFLQAIHNPSNPNPNQGYPAGSARSYSNAVQGVHVQQLEEDSEVLLPVKKGEYYAVSISEELYHKLVSFLPR